MFVFAVFAIADDNIYRAPLDLSYVTQIYRFIVNNRNFVRMALGYDHTVYTATSQTFYRIRNTWPNEASQPSSFSILQGTIRGVIYNPTYNMVSYSEKPFSVVSHHHRYCFSSDVRIVLRFTIMVTMVLYGKCTHHSLISECSLEKVDFVSFILTSFDSFIISDPSGAWTSSYLTQATLCVGNVHSNTLLFENDCEESYKCFNRS